MKDLNGKNKKYLNMGAGELKVIKWYVDASFAVCPDFKINIRVIMKIVQGEMKSVSRKHKLNTRISKKTELGPVGDRLVYILWAVLFIEWWWCKIGKNIFYQDNKSSILLEVNGKRSAGKRIRALNIRYFFMTDKAEEENF